MPTVLGRRGAAIAAVAFAIGAALFFGYVGNVGWGAPGTAAYTAALAGTFLLGALVSLPAFAFLAMGNSRRATV